MDAKTIIQLVMKKGGAKSFATGCVRWLQENAIDDPPTRDLAALKLTPSFHECMKCMPEKVDTEYHEWLHGLHVIGYELTKRLWPVTRN
jgi:hypothetical protein